MKNHLVEIVKTIGETRYTMRTTEEHAARLIASDNRYSWASESKGEESKGEESKGEESKGEESKASGKKAKEPEA